MSLVMSIAHMSLLPNELIDYISKQLIGIDLFHFTLIYRWHLNINNYQLRKVLRRQRVHMLNNELKALIEMSNSPYMISQDGISVVLSSLKWNKFVYGAFKSEIIEKSLKYFSTSMFSLYCRLWSFNPFYYYSSYPTLNIFEYPDLLKPRTLTDEENELFNVWGNNHTTAKVVIGREQFFQNLISRYEYDVWENCIDWDLFIIAGGCVLTSLLINIPKENLFDVDLFFLKKNPRLFERAVNEMEYRLQNKYFVRRKTIWSNRLVQFDLFRNFTINDIFNGKTHTPSVIIQVIHPTLRPVTISRIIHSFDLDICSAALHHKQVVISFSCLQALNSGHTTCYAIPKSRSEFMRRIPRLFKYQKRGFNILCPKEFNLNDLLSTNIEDCNEPREERLYRFRRRHFGDNCDSFALQKKFCEHYQLV